MTGTTKECSNCGNALALTANFCGSCGNRLTLHTSPGPSSKLVVSISYFFALLLINIIIGLTVDFYSFQTDVIASLVLVAVSLSFAYYLGYLRLSTFRTPARFTPVLITIAAALMMAFLVSSIAGWINVLLWDMEYLEIDIYLDTAYPFIYATIFTAIIPAIFEELAFRGFMFGEISKHTNAETALIITSLLFAIIHLSAIGLIWYIPGGFLLGFLRMKYKSISYCILAHFFYNLMIIALDFNKYFTEW